MAVIVVNLRALYSAFVLFAVRALSAIEINQHAPIRVSLASVQ